MTTTIYVVGHKNYNFPNNSIYKPLQVGHGNAFTQYRDNTCLNISEKNANYCELTALYWMWKNDIVSDIIGLTHYRRYFSFKDHNKYYIKTRNIMANHDFENFIKPPDFPRVFEQYDIILPTPEYYINGMYKQYRDCHNIIDLDITIKILLQLYPDYSETLNTVFNRNKAYMCNMFICKKDLFKEYAKWLFSILFEAEKKIVISKEPYQARVFGFLAERLFNVFIEQHNLKILEIPTLFLCENKIDTGIVLRSKRMFLKSLFGIN